MTSQKVNLRNYAIGWHVQKEQNEKCRLAKIHPVSAINYEEILAQVRSERSIEILLRLAWIVDVKIQSI